MSDRDSLTTRRAFLQGFFRRVTMPASKALAALGNEAPAARPRLLRPPGALPEDQFTARCYRCGCCVDQCPVQALAHWQGEDEQLRGTPYLDPDRQACTLCSDLTCMDVCPSGAIERVLRHQIRIGLARVDSGRCARTRGESCQICVERCPVGAEALRLDDIGQVEVLAEGCVGCGICQHACPERPRAITIQAERTP